MKNLFASFLAICFGFILFFISPISTITIATSDDPDFVKPKPPERLEILREKYKIGLDQGEYSEYKNLSEEYSIRYKGAFNKFSKTQSAKHGFKEDIVPWLNFFTSITWFLALIFLKYRDWQDVAGVYLAPLLALLVLPLGLSGVVFLYGILLILGSFNYWKRKSFWFIE